MALYDENGKITIDENAARNDIRLLMLVNESLDEVLTLLNTVNSLALEFDNESNKNILESCLQLKTAIDRIIRSSTETSEYIEQTVKKYRHIDESLKNMIQSSI